MHSSEKASASAVKIILIFGVISLLGDILYESARSVNSQYLSIIGISATKVGLVFGIGEFLGYCLRLGSGLLSDKIGNYGLFMFLGYGMLLVVPLMGLTSSWSLLLVLILLERVGKAIRSPAKDTVLSAVSEKGMGVGFAFGLQEALDQIGAFAGPLIFTAIFYFSGKKDLAQYQTGYRLMIFPFICLMLFLTYALRKIKRDNLIQSIEKTELKHENFQSIFWVYTAFTFFSTLGFVNFSTIAYHLKIREIMSDANITLVYALAMALDAVSALVLGKCYDRLKINTGTKTGGILVLLIIPFLSVFLPLLTLSDSPALITAGMMLFGIIMGTHESIMRSAIADIVPYNKRGTGYGMFNTSYGLALLGGAAIMGILYDRELIHLIITMTIVAEMIALFLYAIMRRVAQSE